MTRRIDQKIKTNKKTLESYLTSKPDEHLISFKLSVELHKQVKAKLKARRLTMKQLLNGAVLAFLSEDKESRK
jgi:hypothetical protein